MPVNRFEFGGLFFSLTYEFAKLERAISAREGVYSGQLRVLTILRNNEGCTLSQLSELCNIGMPSLSVSIQNLAKSGLVRKQTAESDNRVQLLSLTEIGREKAKILHEGIDAFFKGLLEEFGEKGGEQLSAQLEKVTEYIKKAKNDLAAPPAIGKRRAR